MMNPIRPMSPDRRWTPPLLAAPLLLAGLTFSAGCGEEAPPPPPPPPPTVVKPKKPQARPVTDLLVDLDIDDRIHMDEASAHRSEAVRAAALLFVNAMLQDDRTLAKQLSGTDSSVEGMLSNPGFADARMQVEHVDIEFGRIFGDDAMLVIWEFPEHLSAQMWAIGGPVSSGEASFFWPAYTNEFTKAGEADVSDTDNWSWVDDTQVAMFAAPGLRNMIDNLGEKPFEDWSNMVSEWHETAQKPDMVIAQLEYTNTPLNDDDSSTVGPGRPRGPGGGVSPGLRPR